MGEWIKFNFWDWRESDWEDYDIQMDINYNIKYEKQKQMKLSGVRSDYFVHILDIAMLNKYKRRKLGSQLLEALIFGFPSGSKFGVECPATNTVAVKCFTKCGFTIARIDNQHKYKMTMESKYSFSLFQSFRRDSMQTIQRPKIINIESNENESEDDQLQQPQNIIQKAIDHESIDDEESIDGHLPRDDDQEDDDDDDVDSEHQGFDAMQSMQPSVIHQSGQDIMGGIGPLFYGSMASQNNINMHNMHSFVYNKLHQLNLEKYNHIFMDFNIDKNALLHLDPSVVEFMINDENDRNKFLKWLNKYKGSQQKEKPTKAPQQKATHTHTHTDTD